MATVSGNRRWSNTQKKRKHISMILKMLLQMKENKEKAGPYLICPVYWSSLEEEKVEVFSLGCGHLVCGVCGDRGEVVVVGGRVCPVCAHHQEDLLLTYDQHWIGDSTMFDIIYKF